MANTTAVPTVTGQDNTQQNQILFGTIAIGASPLLYAAGGIPISFVGSALTTSQTTPRWSDIKSLSGSGYVYALKASTQKLQIFVESAVAGNPLEELPAGAVPAGVSGDVIGFRVEFKRNA